MTLDLRRLARPRAQVGLMLAHEGQGDLGLVTACRTDEFHLPLKHPVHLPRVTIRRGIRDASVRLQPKAFAQPDHGTEVVAVQFHQRPATRAHQRVHARAGLMTLPPRGCRRRLRIGLAQQAPGLGQLRATHACGEHTGPARQRDQVQNG